VAVKIRLKRIGKKRDPHYRIVVADSRTHRDGRVIEEIGRYVPTTEPSTIEVNSERAQYWLSVGAQPTEQMAVILKITGDLANDKGEKKNTLRSPAAKEAFSADTKKKSVLLPKVEKPVKAEEVSVAEAAEAPAADAPAAETVEAPEVAEVAAEVTEAPAEAAAEVAEEVVSEEVPAEAAAEEAPAEAVAEEAPAAEVEAPVAEATEEPAAEAAEEPKA
jgi:small subunit ribosomal protein S16